jgi:hypothetical protein
MSYYQVILKSGKAHPSLYKTIPNAIKIVCDTIPNIFEYGTYNNKIIVFQNNNKIVLEEGEFIRIYYQGSKRNRRKIVKVYSLNTFEIKEIARRLIALSTSEVIFFKNNSLPAAFLKCFNLSLY